MADRRSALRPAHLPYAGTGPAADPPAPLDRLQSDWQAVTLIEPARWQSFLRALLERLVPARSTQGTPVTVQRAELVLHRVPDGALHTWRLEKKSTALRIVRRIGEESFAAEVNASLLAKLSKDGHTPGPVLFAVGEDDLGGAFVPFDFDHRQSAFIGGMNIGPEYRYDWHDLMVEVA